MDVLVVGAGAMGRWFARAVADWVEEIAFADVDPAAAERAVRGVDKAEEVTRSGASVRTTPVDGDERFDAVCLAVPMPAVEDAVARHAGRAERALLDLTGAMAEPVAAMAAHASDRERVSFHPLFAPENEPGNVAVVADEPGPITDRFREALAARGNQVFETTPEEHDVAMETVQASAHAAILAYALAGATDVREEFHTPVSAGLSDLAAQVTAGSPGVYAEIQVAFDGAEKVAAAAERIATADPETFAELYDRAGERIGAGGRAERASDSEHAGDSRT